MSGNDPTDRDSDGDGIKDGAEHGGVVTAFDGETVTVREFTTRKLVTATVDTECSPAEDINADDSSYDDDEGFVDVDEVESFEPEFTASAAQADDDGFEEEVDLGDDEDVDADASSCDDVEDLEKGTVLSGAEYENDGGTVYLVDYTTV